jgi:hypothetical protein
MFIGIAMSNDNQYSLPLSKSWAIELRALLRSHNYEISNGHALQLVSAYWGFKSHDHICNSQLYHSDRLPEDFSADCNLVKARSAHLKHPPELILPALQFLHEEERDVFKSLAKRLVRNVLNNCERVHGEYCHSVLLTIPDASLCHDVTSKDFFVDFLFGRYPFTARQTFSEVKPHPGMNGHFMANPDAALNVAAFLHRPALDILHFKHPGEKMMTSLTNSAIDNLDLPSLDEVEDLSNQVSDLKEEVEEYRSEAEWIDSRYEAQNEGRRISLDDLPYGEELIRIRPLPEMLNRSESLLKKISKNDLGPNEKSDAFDEANQLLEEARATFDDLTPLPAE